MKEYVKPELFFESFELSEQIATCKFNSNNSNTDVANCCFTGADEDSFIFHGIYFTEANQACSKKYDEYCYHSSTSGGLNLFNS